MITGIPGTHITVSHLRDMSSVSVQIRLQACFNRPALPEDLLQTVENDFLNGVVFSDRYSAKLLTTSSFLMQVPFGLVNPGIFE